MTKRTEKDELEIIKLNKEIHHYNIQINELSKSWYKKPQWIIALSPLIVGMLTLIVAWSTGFLQAQSTLNKIELKKLNEQKDSINEVITLLTHKSDSLSRFVTLLSQDRAVLISQNAEFKNINDSLIMQLLNRSEKNKYIAQKYILAKKDNRNLKLNRCFILAKELEDKLYVHQAYLDSLYITQEADKLLENLTSKK